MQDRNDDAIEAADTEEQRPRFRVRLPGFLLVEEVRAGDVIARATSTAGIRPCDGCHRRAAALNRWVSFVPGRSR